MENTQIITNVKEYFATHPDAKSVTISCDGFLFYKREDAALHTASLNVEGVKHVTVTREEFAEQHAMIQTLNGGAEDSRGNAGNTDEEPGKGSEAEEEGGKSESTEEEPSNGGDTDEEPAKASSAAAEPGKSGDSEEKPQAKPSTTQTTRRPSTRK